MHGLGPFPLPREREREGDQTGSTEPIPRARRRAHFHGAIEPEAHRWHGLHPWKRLSVAPTKLLSWNSMAPDGWAGMLARCSAVRLSR